MNRTTRFLLLTVLLGGGISPGAYLSNELTVGDVQTAAKVTGPEFTTDEIELMLPDLENSSRRVS